MANEGKQSQNAKSKKQPGQRSIKTKLIAVMIAVVSIPLIVTLAISYFSSTNKALEDAETSLSWQSQYIASEFNTVIKENLDLIEAIANNPTTIVYMEGTAGIDDDVMIQMLQVNDAILDDGNVIAIADATGMQVVKSSGTLTDVSSREYFQEAKKGNSYISNVLVNSTTGDRMITMCVPIKGSNGDIIGTVQRNYSLSALHELLI